jgi:16S rRNA (cytosine967-C5)-methyltransferase
MKVEHQIRTFEKILASYDGKLPLHRFLVNYFKAHKQMGSSDRRLASRYLYSYFRLGNALKDVPVIERLAIADFLCNMDASLVVTTYQAELADQVALPVQAKLALVRDKYPEFDLQDVFPFHLQRSAEINWSLFLQSFFTQPDLYIRVKEKYTQDVAEQLRQSGVPVRDLSEVILAMPNGTKLDQILPNQKHYQIQDLSSQKTGKYFQPKPHDYWWDCCAASGGKSLLLHDLEPKIQLLVSDVRESSLTNLDERFEDYGLKKYQKKVLDLLQNNEVDLHHYEFDGIILDAPCSGSGTWGRTPEMLSFFDAHKISYFSGLQKTIATNVVKYLKPGKPLIYITCSVFRQENEEVVAYLEKALHLKVEAMETITGYTDKADSMFVARLIKPSL